MSLLLDARKKIELALEQSGIHNAIEPQLSEAMRFEDLSPPAAGVATGDAPKAGNPLAAKAGAELTPQPDNRSLGAGSDPVAAGKNLFAAKSTPANKRLGIIPIALITGLVLAAGGGYYVWREISPPPMAQRQRSALPPVAPVTNTVAPNPAPKLALAPAVPAPKDMPVTTKDSPVTPKDLPDTLDKRPVAAKTVAVPNGHGRSPDGTTSHLTKPAKDAGYLPHPHLNPLPQAGEEANVKSNLQFLGEGDKVSLRKFPVKNSPSPKPVTHTPQTAPAKPAQPLHIEHKQEGDAVDPTLLAGYQAYRNGDLRTAWQHYSDVLHKDAKNRDALLGLAAIAQQQSQDTIAARYYDQVLALDPRDPIAHAGMSALFGAANAAGTESRLKLLLSQQPQSAALHFALGNHYAEQSRWGDAQQAYFNAYGIDPGNAQFAFNLAVSLDHLGQSKPAAQYYQRALQLDTSDSAGFDRTQTQQRLQELATP